MCCMFFCTKVGWREDQEIYRGSKKSIDKDGIILPGRSVPPGSFNTWNEKSHLSLIWCSLESRAVLLLQCLSSGSGWGKTLTANQEVMELSVPSAFHGQTEIMERKTLPLSIKVEVIDICNWEKERWCPKTEQGRPWHKSKRVIPANRWKGCLKLSFWSWSSH